MEFEQHTDEENAVVFTRVVSRFEVDGIEYEPPLYGQRHRWCPIFNFRGDVEVSATAGWHWRAEPGRTYGNSFQVFE